MVIRGAYRRIRNDTKWKWLRYQGFDKSAVVKFCTSWYGRDLWVSAGVWIVGRFLCFDNHLFLRYQFRKIGKHRIFLMLSLIIILLLFHCLDGYITTKNFEMTISVCHVNDFLRASLSHTLKVENGNQIFC